MRDVREWEGIVPNGDVCSLVIDSASINVRPASLPPPLMFSSDNFKLYPSKLGTNQELNVTSQYGPRTICLTPNTGHPPV